MEDARRILNGHLVKSLFGALIVLLIALPLVLYLNLWETAILIAGTLVLLGKAVNKGRKMPVPDLMAIKPDVGRLLRARSSGLEDVTMGEIDSLIDNLRALISATERLCDGLGMQSGITSWTLPVGVIAFALAAIITIIGVFVGWTKHAESLEDLLLLLAMMLTMLSIVLLLIYSSPSLYFGKEIALSVQKPRVIALLNRFESIKLGYLLEELARFAERQSNGLEKGDFRKATYPDAATLLLTLTLIALLLRSSFTVLALIELGTALCIIAIKSRDILVDYLVVWNLSLLLATLKEAVILKTAFYEIFGIPFKVTKACYDLAVSRRCFDILEVRNMVLNLFAMGKATSF